MSSERDGRQTSAISGELVPLDSGRAGIAPCPRPLAGFVTQLLACRDQMPAYRARRRAQPDLAAACYGDQGAAAQPSRFRRIL
jgi:hypothetical protein